ncbi:cold-shock' DNA-binding domain-domain-containing protein [Leucosporidium creatinivorum]|uniref:Cold-shock' DNA-binding domain-domain-containing protein n=1 Tax=Leucosporidium creatinivorum TaxID=106004 RepID=A0A1Y2DKY0_9BASI|nr:cold-shock' DNA-binding domain-domain-containing protein [Leucosporidium creatinivorum]
MSTDSEQHQPLEKLEIAPGSAPLQRRHSIHTTSPTSTDGLPLPEEPTAPAPSDSASPELAEEDRPAGEAAAGQPSGLASFDSLYSAINSVPVEAHHHPYYPIGGPSATYPSAAAPQFASEWGSPPSLQRHLGGDGHSLQNPPLYPVPGRGEKRTGRCKFFNALKGFGFIIDHHGEELGNDVEVFVHYTAIDSIQTGRGGFRSLLEGEEVEYTIMQGPKGWQAQSVTGPNGMPCIGSPSNTTKNLGPAPDGYHRKFSVGSMSSDDFRPYGGGGGYGSKRNGRGGGLDSGYYSSAMTSPVQTPHQLYSPPQYPAYPHPSPHASYGPPPVGIPLALHHGNAYSFLPPPPPPHTVLASPDGASPPGGTLLLPNVNPNAPPDESDPNSPYRPLPPSTFYQPGPPPPLRGGPGGPPNMQGYYPISNGGPPGYYPPAGYDGYPQPGFGGLPSLSQPYPLPLPSGMAGSGGWAEAPLEQDEHEVEVEVSAGSEKAGAEEEVRPAPTVVAA